VQHAACRVKHWVKRMAQCSIPCRAAVAVSSPAALPAFGATPSVGKVMELIGRRRASDVHYRDIQGE